MNATEAASVDAEASSAIGGESGAATANGPTNFAAALSTWRAINLGELQKTLDAQGLEVVENQKENMVGRKKLAEQTREFKKINDEEKLVAFKGLLKAYQGEIDALTKRSKVSENAFLNVYKRLAEAPDPFPLLDAAVDQTARASEARILEATLQREREETATLKTQLVEAQSVETERKKLADRCAKLEAKMDDMIETRVTSKEAELNAIYDERIRNFEEREKDLQKQVSVARDQLKDLRTSNETTNARLLGQNQRQDQDTLSRLAEMELLTADVARANARVADVERRNEKLRAEIESVRSGSESSTKISTLEAQVTDLQTETSRLIRSMEAQSESTSRDKEQTQRKESEREAVVAKQTQEISALTDRLANYADYDEIKRELEIMKFVEFSGASMDDDEEQTEIGDESMSVADSVLRLPDPNGDKARGRGKPLENLLLKKNRKMQEQLTNLRVAFEELSSANAQAQSQASNLEKDLKEQRELNDRLERDLSRMNGGPATSASTNTSANDAVSNRPESKSPSTRQDALSSLNLGKRSVTPEPANSVPGLTAAAESSILPIITSQRDRFRARNGELEEEIRKAQSQMQELRNETKALQADNVKLYEKIRYLQSYRDESNAPSSLSKSLYGIGPSKSKDDSQLGKYRNLYEQSMNPFEAFKGRERSSAVQALNPVEAILLGMANIILSNRIRRGFFVLYALGLHLFVFMSLLGWASTADTQTAVPLPNR